MATTDTSTATLPSGSFAKWTSWLAALVGLWVVVSPFVLTGSFGGGTPMLSSVVAGLAILVLGAYTSYAIRSAAEGASGTWPEWSGWIGALAGLWIAFSPFVLSGSIGSGTPMLSSVVGGLVALVLTAYTGYEIHTGA
ncbi:MAG: SPW repeat protein [Halobacteriaceae archaeon]